MTEDPFDVPGEMRGPVDASTAPVAPTPAGDEWTVYGGTAYGQRYSTLADITPTNVDGLQLAWTFHTGDKQGPNDPKETTAENVPLKVGDMLYLCSKHDHVIALDPVTGLRRWEFDPKIEVSHDFQHLNCRGLAYHDGTLAAATAAPAPASTPGPAASGATNVVAAAAGVACTKRSSCRRSTRACSSSMRRRASRAPASARTVSSSLPSTWATSSPASTWKRRRRS